MGLEGVGTIAFAGRHRDRSGCEEYQGGYWRHAVSASCGKRLLVLPGSVVRRDRKAGEMRSDSALPGADQQELEVSLAEVRVGPGDDTPIG